MSYETGCLVRANAGRDKGELFWVVGRQEETGRLLLADGKRRKGKDPKVKSPKHVEAADTAGHSPPDPVTQALQRGETVSDRELRRAIAAFKEEMSLGKG